MRIVTYEEDRHFPRMALWWSQRNFPTPDTDFLPPHGLFVENDEMGICGGFVFLTDAKLALINHLVSNPNAPALMRNEALDLLIKGLMHVAQEAGKRFISAATDLEALLQRYERLGFSRFDSEMIHMGRGI